MNIRAATLLWWWGQAWDGHDKGVAGAWRVQPGPDNLGKLSRGGNRPKVRGVLYQLTDGANGTGIDSVWRAEGHNDGKPYAIVEAKASADEDARKFQRLATRKPSIVSKLGVSGSVDASDLLEPLEDATASSRPGRGKGGGGKPTSGAGGTGKPKAQAGTSANHGTTSAPPAMAKGGKPVLVQMSREWVLANLNSAVGHLAEDIRAAGFSRHLFFSPLYFPCAVKHSEARISGAPATEHSSHDAIHYDEAEVKRAVNTKKAALRRMHGNLRSLMEEI